MKFFDGAQGWEILYCPRCGYAVEKSDITRNFVYCPLCTRKGRQVKLGDRFVVHRPENKVLKPKQV